MPDGTFVHDHLIRAASAAPDATALVVGETTYSHGDVERASRHLAAALRSRGLRRGDRVVIVAESSAELVVALWGTLRAGGVFVVVNPSTKADKLRFILDDCAAAAVVAQSKLARVVAPASNGAGSVGTVWWFGTGPGSAAPASGGRHGPGRDQPLELEDLLAGDPAAPAPAGPAAPYLPGEPDADPGLIDADLAGLVYTSGSTGQPKGVMLTHRNVAHNTWSISTYLGLRHDDVIACLLPLSFDYGLFQVFMAARVGAAVVLERSFAYPRDVLDRLAATRATVLPGVPTIFATLLQHAPFEGVDLSSLRMLTNTAAALPPAHIDRLTRAFPGTALFSMYGLTECTRVSYLPPDRLADKPTSVGRAMPNTEAYVVDGEGRRVGPGVEGELVIRGASVMRGYWNRPQETAACLRDGEVEGEKVLHTGDRFLTDEEGFLYFVGRWDDVFKCKGEKISPREVEQVLYELDDVAEAAVVGVAHELDGTAVKAVVVARAGATLTESQVRGHCRARLESHMVPRVVEVRDGLPKTDSGKIRRASLERAL